MGVLSTASRGAAAPSSVPGPGPGRPRSGSRLLVAIGVAAVAVLLASVYLWGGFGHGSSGSPGGIRFSTAASEGLTAAGTVAGGPWSLVSAVGFDSSASVTVNASAPVGSNCTVAPVGSSPVPSTLEIPGLGASPADGVASWWGLLFLTTASSDVLLIEATTAGVTPVLIASGSCVHEVADLKTVPASGVIDSPTAASATWGAGGSAFASVHSNVSLTSEMLVIGGGTFDSLTVGPTWLVEYSPCLPLGQGGPGGTQSEFEALVNATSGELFPTFPVVTSTTC